MLRLFQKNIGLQTLVVLAVAIGLWVPSLMHPSAAAHPDGSGVLYDLCATWLPPLAATIVALVLVALEGVMLNLLLVRVGLTAATSLLPTLLYILVMASSSTTLTPMVMVSGVMIAFVDQVMIRGSLLAIPVGKICAATALIGICTMFYLPSVLMLVAYLLIAVNYRLYSWRDWTALLLGLLAPYIALLTIAYLTDSLVPWWEQTLATIEHPSLEASLPSWGRTLANGWMGVVMVAGVVALSSQMNDHPVVWQKNALSAAMPAIGGLLMLLYSGFFPIDMQLFAIPFALCATLLLTPARPSMGHSPHHAKRKEWVKNIAFLLTLIAAIVC